jgi:hypothetical protein
MERSDTSLLKWFVKQCADRQLVAADLEDVIIVVKGTVCKVVFFIMAQKFRKLKLREGQGYYADNRCIKRLYTETISCT